MFQLLRVNQQVLPTLRVMFDELGEPVQVLTPESPRPLVVHNTMGQLTLVAEGTGYVSLAGETFPIRAGDLIIMTPECRHSFYCPDGKLVIRHWHWPQALLNRDRTVVAKTFDFGLLENEGGRA